MINVYNFFKFIESKEPEYRTPFKLKLKLAPEDITKEDLHIKDDSFSLHDYPTHVRDNDNSITSLPDGMTVESYLSLNSKYLESIPNNLTVRGNLYVGTPQISSLPEDLKVDGDVHIYDTSAGRKYSKYPQEELKKMFPGVKGKIYTDYKQFTDYLDKL